MTARARGACGREDGDDARRCPAEQGGILPAALILLTFALLVGLEAALLAGSVRWGAARAGAGEQAYRNAEAGLALAARMAPADLVSALDSGEPLDLTRAGLPPLPGAVEVRVLDDDDGDPARDINGRVRLQARGTARVGPSRWPAQRTLDAEALIGMLTPLPAAALDCTGSVALCGGADGCELPPALLAGPRAALGASFSGLPTLRLRLWELAREVLRRAGERCALPSGCEADSEDLWRAAATGVMRAVTDPAADATALGAGEVSRLVSNLLALGGDEAGLGWVTWLDGTVRPVARMEDLVGVLDRLHRPSGHAPDLTGHPFPTFLSAPVAAGLDGGLCLRLPALVQAARQGARPVGLETGGAETLVLAEPLVLRPGETLAGAGLLLVEASLALEAGASLVWRGVIVLAGGRIDGPGRVELRGGLVDLGGRRSGEAGFSLEVTAWDVVAEASSWYDAWRLAGTVLLSRWERVSGE